MDYKISYKQTFLSVLTLVLFWVFPLFLCDYKRCHLWASFSPVYEEAAVWGNSHTFSNFSMAREAPVKRIQRFILTAIYLLHVLVHEDRRTSGLSLAFISAFKTTVIRLLLRMPASHLWYLEIPWNIKAD